MKRRRFLALSGTAAAGAAFAPRAALAADTVKVGMLRAPTALLVGMELGYFGGQGIDVQPVYVDAAANVVPQLSSGEIDVGLIAPDAAMFNALELGVNATIVADYWASGKDVPPGDSAFIMVRKDLAPYGTFKNGTAQGLTMAITARGQLSELFADTYLLSAKTSPGDVNIIEMPFTDMNTALFNHAVDLAVVIDPYATQLAAQGTAVKVASLSSLMPGCVEGVMLYGQRLGKADRTLGMRFMRAFSQANLYFRAQLATVAGRAGIAQIYQKYIPADDPALYTKIGLAVAPAKLTVEVEGNYALHWQLNQYVKALLVDTPAPNLSKSVDNSFATAVFAEATVTPRSK